MNHALLRLRIGTAWRCSAITSETQSANAAASFAREGCHSYNILTAREMRDRCASRLDVRGEITGEILKQLDPVALRITDPGEVPVVVPFFLLHFDSRFAKPFDQRG